MYYDVSTGVEVDKQAIGKNYRSFMLLPVLDDQEQHVLMAIGPDDSEITLVPNTQLVRERFEDIALSKTYFYRYSKEKGEFASYTIRKESSSEKYTCKFIANAVFPVDTERIVTFQTQP